MNLNIIKEDTKKKEIKVNETSKIDKDASADEKESEDKPNIEIIFQKRKKNETPEEKEERKKKIKQFKQERKEKKKNFKNQFEVL
jgi:hypothetical protein